MSGQPSARWIQSSRSADCWTPSWLTA